MIRDRFRSILLIQVPGGGSRETLEGAVELARRDGARLVILAAIGDAPSRPKVRTEPPLDLEGLVLQEHRERLEELAAPYRDGGLEVETAVRTGRPFVAIVREVLEHGHDLVIKTAEGAHGLEQRLFGTTGMHLIRKCPCPVWLVKPAGGGRPGPILAAVDPSPDDDPLSPDDEHFRLNEVILRMAGSLARAQGRELVIAHAWSLYGEALLRGRGRMSAEAVDALVEETRRTHEAELEELLARLDLAGVRHRLEVVKGDAGDVIPALAEREGVDLVVMGSVGRTGIEGFLIGNTAETVLGRVDCSVLTVKPEGFVSPVRLPGTARPSRAR